MNLRLPAIFNLCFLFLFSISQGQIFVKTDASGQNDGSSWENAFTALQDAIEAADAGDQIWVAAGTYRPAEATAPSTATFFITKQLEIYGGFEGTETALDLRDYETNLTLLSGDLLGDDLPEEDSLRKNDNVFNVITLDSNISNSTILDGFYIENGFANGNIEDNPRYGRGGGIFTTGAPTIRNCVIRNNFSIDDGAGVYQSGIFTSGTIFLNCEISNNISRDDGGGLKLFAANGPQTQLINCRIFQNEAVTAGGGIHIKGTNALLTGTLIENNSTEKFGGGIDIEQSLEFSDLNVVLDSCTITRNISNNIGGGMLYFSDRTGNQLNIRNTLFSNNNATESGAGAYLQLWIINEESEINIENSDFIENNVLLGSGGGLFYDVRAINSRLELIACEFRGNTSALEGGGIQVDLQRGDLHQIALTGGIMENNQSDYGGGMYILTRNRSKGNLDISGTEFQNNSGNRFSGGAGAIDGFLDGESFNIKVDNSRFETNEGRSGGGINVEVAPNSGGSLFVSNSTFLSNQARNFGGAISFFLDGGRGNFSMSGTLIGQNRSGVGGGISYRSELGGEGNVSVSKSQFVDNTAFQGAGGFIVQLPDKFSNSIIDVDSCLFEKNVAEENVGGLAIDSASDTLFANITRSVFTRNQAPDFGGLYVQQTLGQKSEGQINIANSLFSENITIIGATIGVFSYPVKITNCTIALNKAAGLDLIGESELTLQNNLFHNPNRFEFRALDTLGTVISLGGNLSSDVSMGNVLGENDIQQTDPLLIEDGEFSYRLSAESPALDAGVDTEDASGSDLAGNPRIQGAGIDIGAFEGGFVTSIRNQLAEASELTIFPNPFSKRMTLILDNRWRRDIRLQMVDIMGKTVYSRQLEKNKAQKAFELVLTNLANGPYNLILTDGNEYLVKLIVKE